MHLHDLPDELLSLVFLKLPISSVLVARAVCKSWNLFLSSNSFLTEHDATSPRESWNIAQNYNRDLKLFKTTINKQVQLQVPSRNWFLAKASEGLLCFISSFDVKKVLVYNPVTRASREIEGPLPVERRHFWNFTCSKETGEWKVVILNQPDLEEHMAAPAHVFCSKTGKWKLSSKPVRERHDYIPLTITTCNPLLAYDCYENVVVTYDMDTDSWTELEFTPATIEGDWTGFHCTGHGTFVVNSIEEEYGEEDRIEVFKHISDKRKWELVSQSPLVVDPIGSAFHISDGQDNIWIPFSHTQLLYNVASNKWRSFQDFSLRLVTCCTFTFRQP